MLRKPLDRWLAVMLILTFVAFVGLSFPGAVRAAESQDTVQTSEDESTSQEETVTSDEEQGDDTADEDSESGDAVEDEDEHMMDTEHEDETMMDDPHDAEHEMDVHEDEEEEDEADDHFGPRGRGKKIKRWMKLHEEHRRGLLRAHEVISRILERAPHAARPALARVLARLQALQGLDTVDDETLEDVAEELEEAIDLAEEEVEAAEEAAEEETEEEAEVLSLSAEFHELAGDLERAEKAYKRAIKMAKKRLELYKKYGQLRRKLGKKGLTAFVNGQEPEFDVPPFIRDGRTLVPIRAITETLGALVTWDPETRTVTIVRGNITVILRIDNVVAEVNGRRIILDVPATIEKGRTVIPIRFVSEAFGAYVDWLGEEGIIVVIE